MLVFVILVTSAWPSSMARAEDATLTELKLLKARIKQLEERVANQDRRQKSMRASVRGQQKALIDKTSDLQSKQAALTSRQTSFETRLKRVAYGPPTTSTTTGPVGLSKPGEHWYDRLSLRGYTQARLNSFLDGNRELYRLPGDRSVALDRNDATNTCCRDERDVGLFLYYTPEHLRHVFRDLVKNNLKGSGDYGLFALGLYNGQGANRVELNNEMHVVSRVTYPYTFANGQIVEAGVQGYVGRFVPTTGAIGAAAPTLNTDRKGFRDERVGVHAVLYPQPFGLQAEWNWGRGPQLDAAQAAIETNSLQGGYIQASYKYEDRLFRSGIYFPFIKYQHFRGASKFEVNAPVNRVDDYEAGVEWQIRPELELTTTYSKLHRTNLFTAPYKTFRADVVRTQLQFNY